MRGPLTLRTAGLLLLGALLVAHALHFDYAPDDAFITFRYVDNMLAGQGLVYNPGERVEGYTNFLWAMLIALPGALGADLVAAARVLGVLSAIATIVLVTLLARVMIAGDDAGGASRLAVLFPAALLVANGSFAMWAGSGMETPLFTLLLTAATLTYVGVKGRARMHVTGVLLALLVMTRPDGIVFLAAFLAHRGIRALRGEAPARRRAVTDAGRLLLAFAVVYLPYFAWRYTYYGYLLPNTFYAKVGGGSAAALRGLGYVWDAARSYGVVLPLAAVGFVVARLGRGRRETATPSTRGGFLDLLGLQVLACVAFVVYVGGDQLVMHRFFVPAWPPLYLLSLAGLWAVLRRFRGATPRGAVAAASVAALAITAIPSFAGSEHERVFEVERPADRDRAIVGRWLADHLAPGASIALIPAGIIPYYSGLPTIDMLGLNDEHIAHVEIEGFGSGTAGHEKHDSAYVLSRRPDLIFLGACRPAPRKVSTRQLVDYYRIYGGLASGNLEMLQLPELVRHYVPAAAPVDGRYLHFLKRREFDMPLAEPLR